VAKETVMLDLKLPFAIILTSLALSGCSAYSTAVNSLGPDSPVSDLRAPEGEYVLSEEPPIFCPAPEDLRPPEPIIRTVYFENDTTILTDESQNLIGEIYQDILIYPAAEISIIGHTDTQASADYNLGLSKRRAELIKTNLVEIGIEPSIITTEGRGEGDLLVQTADNISEVRNRRVVIEVR